MGIMMTSMFNFFGEKIRKMGTLNSPNPGLNVINVGKPPRSGLSLIEVMLD